MKTKNFFIALMLALLLLPAGAKADVGTFTQRIGDKPNLAILTYTVEYTSGQSTAIITGFDVSLGVVTNLDLVIPSSCTISGTEYNIEGIDANAFKNNTILKTVKFPASIVGIGESAFEGCTNLTAVGFLTTKPLQIGNYAFKGCTQLANIAIPSRTASIGTNAFLNCNSSQGGPTVAIWKASNSSAIAANLLNGQYVKSVEMASGITTIGVGAFRGISNLQSVTLPASLTTIGASAFLGCTSLTSVTIPANVTSIGNNAFNCGSTLDVSVNWMVPIDIPSGTDPFPNRREEGYVLHVPFGVVSPYANHAYWSTFNSVQVPATYTASNGIVYGWVDGTDNLTVIGCEGWTSQQNVTIADHFQFGEFKYTVTEIRDEAFMDCEFLDAIEIPSSITKIGHDAFLSSELRSVTFHEGLEIIDINAFNNTKLTTVNIPSTVTDIGTGTFNNCSYLESAVIRGQITYFANQIFQNCINLVDVTLPSTLQIIDQSVFSGCKKLESIVLPASLTSMKAAVFRDCTKLKNIYFEGLTPPTVDTSYNGDLFRDASGDGVIDHSTITLHVPFGAVDYCSPDSYWSDFIIDMAPGEVADYQTVKYSCRFNSDGTGYAEVTGLYDSSVTSIAIMESVNNYVGDELMAFPVTKIASNAFAGNSNLVTVSIPASVNTIDADAFKDCTGLKKVTLTTTLEQFPTDAFTTTDQLHPLKFEFEMALGSSDAVSASFAQNCKAITSVTIGEDVKTIGMYAFQDCPFIKSVTIPSSVEEINANAFGIANPNYTSALTDVTVEWDTPITIETQYDPFPKNAQGAHKQIKLHVPYGRESLYSSDSYWGTFDISVDNMFTDANGINYRLNSNEGVSFASVAGYQGTETSLNIPRSITVGGTTYPVTAVDWYAFTSADGNSTLERVTLPESIKNIYEGAFYGLPNLAKVVIPASVESVDPKAFSGYEGFVRSVPLDVEIVGFGYDPRSNVVKESLFENLTDVNSVTLVNIYAIGDKAFKNCSSLESITIPTTVRSIARSAFDGTTSLTKVIAKWTSASEIVNNGTIFYDQYRTATLYVPTGTKALYLEAESWKDFSKIVDNIDFADDNVEAICVANWDTDRDGGISSEEAAAVTNLNQVFKANTDIKKFQELRYFTGLTEIGVSDFEGCTSLEIVELPTNVTKILTKAFYGCSSLQGISGGYQFCIPVQVTSIGEEAFANCRPASRIQIFGPAVIWERAFAGSLINSSESQVYITSALNSIATDAFDETGALFYINSSNDTPIGVWLFKDCTFLKNLSVNAPIEANAFMGCTNLESVFFSDGVTSIGASAFQGCSQLQEVELPWTLQTVSVGAFSECTALSKVTINAQVTSIDKWAFSRSTNLQTIIVKAATPPSLVESAFDNTVYNTATLFVLEESAQAYGATSPWSKFKNWGVIDSQGIRYTYATVDDSPKATVVGYKGWADDLVIAGSVKGHDGQVYPVKEINTYPAFELARNYFTSITIPASMTTIQEWAFAENVNLKTVKVGWSDPRDLSIIPRIFNWTPINPNPDDPENTNGEGILYVPAGTTALYQSTAPWSYFKTFMEYQPGNANGDDDNTIDINDVLAIVDYILGKNVPATFNAAAADVNGDGRVTIADAAAVVNIILGTGN